MKINQDNGRPSSRERLNITEAVINVLDEHNLGGNALELTTDYASVMLVCGRTLAKSWKMSLTT
ncbi:6620_t:CDS:2 [Paraglomus occultum]|uniref:6620_t:CDS:1 n=1 Tax=Paraglomus occultum TaxID=144539 RepID=A0A9N9BNK8_9GLOM|nr:6620_t:CDS:2 [Paraglomus occultum]